MSVKINKKPISETLKELLENGKLTERQRVIWVKYLSFLDNEQVKDLCEIIEKDKESFDILMLELEHSVSK